MNIARLIFDRLNKNQATLDKKIAENKAEGIVLQAQKESDAKDFASALAASMAAQTTAATTTETTSTVAPVVDQSITTPA